MTENETIIQGLNQFRQEIQGLTQQVTILGSVVAEIRKQRSWNRIYEHCLAQVDRQAARLNGQVIREGVAYNNRHVQNFKQAMENLRLINLVAPTSRRNLGGQNNG